VGCCLGKLFHNFEGPSQNGGLKQRVRSFDSSSASGTLALRSRVPQRKQTPNCCSECSWDSCLVVAETGLNGQPRWGVSELLSASPREGQAHLQPGVTRTELTRDEPLVYSRLFASKGGATAPYASVAPPQITTYQTMLQATA
jgi:hypothetical protein